MEARNNLAFLTGAQWDARVIQAAQIYLYFEGTVILF